MMPAVRENLTIEQGASFFKNIKYMETDQITPVDLTSYTARMHIRANVESEVILQSLVSPTEITLGGAAGTIQLYLSPVVTAAITYESGVYDLELEDAGGDVTRLIYGGVEVTPEVTR